MCQRIYIISNSPSFPSSINNNKKKSPSFSTLQLTFTSKIYQTTQFVYQLKSNLILSMACYDKGRKLHSHRITLGNISFFFRVCMYTISAHKRFNFKLLSMWIELPCYELQLAREIPKSIMRPCDRRNVHSGTRVLPTPKFFYFCYSIYSFSISFSHTQLKIIDINLAYFL